MNARNRRMRQEILQIIRFVCVGGVTVVGCIGGYILLSRFLWPSGNRTVENGIVMTSMSLLNFYAHRRWTFPTKTSVTRSGLRYLFVLITANIIQLTLFWIGHVILQIHDLFVIVAVQAFIPFYTFVMHRFFTFSLHSSSDKSAPSCYT